MKDFDNNGAWKKAFNSMFGAIGMLDCTPREVLNTMNAMARSSNRLHDIVIACRSRNIAANDDNVLECLRTLYREGKILHREVAERHFFIRK